jgi:hypothetical protein
MLPFAARLFYNNGNWQSCVEFASNFNIPGRALTVYDDGIHGPRIFLGTDDGTTTARVLVWNGASWDPFITVSGVWFQDPSNRRVATLTTYDDDGPGPHRPVLVVGGAFIHINTFLPDCNNIARWDGMTWSRFGNGLLGSVQPVVTCAYAADIGNGPRLYAAGALSAAGQGAVEQIAQWDGQQWLSMAGGIQYSGHEITAMTAWDSGTGLKLWVGASYNQSAHDLSAWDGAQWSAPTGGVQLNAIDDGIIRSMKVHDDGRGPALFVAGHFNTAGPNGSVPALNIARYGPTPCRANCDGSLQANCATLNVLDFNCFLNRFAAQDNRANCDGSTIPPALNVLDFNCFLNAFTSGCP